MENIKISIIMPIYNTGRYLYESLYSIAAQVFRKFELICVNDATEDEETLEILTEFQKRNPNCKIIHLSEKTGAGEARNIGFAEAQGEYVLFLDADDIFDCNLLKIMYQEITDYEADVCICGYESFYIDANGRHSLGMHMPKEVVGITDKVFSFEDLREDGLTYWGTAPWNKLCKRKFISENKINFQNISSSNDVYFSCMAVLLAERICYVKSNQALISYREKNGKQISANRKPVNLLKAVMLVNQRLEELGLFEKHGSKLYYFLLKNSIYEWQTCKEEKENEEYYGLLKDYFWQSTSGMIFEDKFFSFCRTHLLEESYESKWFMLVDDFYQQLNIAAEDLKKVLEGFHHIVLWGMGKRGKAFQRFCYENHIPLLGVADKTNLRINEKTEWGYDVIRTEKAFYMADLIVASNTEIFEHLSGENRKISLMNLNEYCPY